MGLIDLQFDGPAEEEVTPTATGRPRIDLEFEGEQGREPLPQGVTGYAESTDRGIVEWINDAFMEGYTGARQQIAEQAGLVFDKTREDKISTAVRLKELERERERYGPELSEMEGMRKLADADTFGEWLEAAWNHPDALAQITISSIGRLVPVYAVGAGAAAATGGATLPVMAATFPGYLATEYSATMDETIREAGMDPMDPMSWVRATSDEQLLEDARERGLKRGIPIAVFDTLSMGLSGKLLATAKPTAGSILSRSAGEVAQQSLTGGLGEYSAQMWEHDFDPSKIKMGEVFTEAAAEIGPGGVETVIGYKSAKEQALRRQMAKQAGYDAAQREADKKLVPDFEVKSVEENETAIDDALNAVPPTPETPLEDELLTEPVETPAPLDAEQQRAEDEANAFVLRELRKQFPEASEEELLAAIEAFRPPTEQLPTEQDLGFTPTEETTDLDLDLDEAAVDEITREEIVQATEPVAGNALETAENWRTAHPEFADTILSFAPGTERQGEPMEHYYGEIAGTEDKDGMPIDVMLNAEHDPGADTPIFIVNQLDPDTQEFRQHKVMAGFDEMAEAEQAYINQWGEDSWASTHELTPEQFKAWRDRGNHKEPYSDTFAAELEAPATEKVPDTEPTAADITEVSPEDFDAMLEDVESDTTEVVEPETPPEQTQIRASEGETPAELLAEGLGELHYTDVVPSGFSLEKSLNVDRIASMVGEDDANRVREILKDPDAKRAIMAFWKGPADDADARQAAVDAIQAAAAKIAPALEDMDLDQVRAHIKELDKQYRRANQAGEDSSEFEARGDEARARLRELKGDDRDTDLLGEPVDEKPTTGKSDTTADDAIDLVDSGDIDKTGRVELYNMMKALGYEVEDRDADMTTHEMRTWIKGWVGSEKKARAEVKRRERGAEIARQNQAVSETDDLVTFLRKQGGVNVDTDIELRKAFEGLGTEKVIGLSGLSQTGDKGLAVDDAVERAWQAGYITDNDLTEFKAKIDDAKVGPVYNLAGLEAEARQQQEEFDSQREQEYREQLEQDADDMTAYIVEQSGGPAYSSEDIPELISLAADVDYDAVLDVTFDNTLSEDEVRTRLQAIIDGEYQSRETAEGEAGERAQEVPESAPEVPQETPETAEATEDSIRGIPISPRMSEAIGIVGRDQYTKKLKKRGNRLRAEKGSRHLQRIADALAVEIISDNWVGAPDSNKYGVFDGESPDTITLSYQGLKKDTTQMELHVLQIAENLWSFGWSLGGKYAGSSSGIGYYDVAESQEAAQLKVLGVAKDFWSDILGDTSSMSSNAAKTEAKRALKWVDEQIASIAPEPADNLITGEGFDTPRAYFDAINAKAEADYPEAIQGWLDAKDDIKAAAPRAWQSRFDFAQAEAGYYTGYHMRQSGMEPTEILDALEALEAQVGIAASEGFHNSAWAGQAFTPPEGQVDFVGKTAEQESKQAIEDEKRRLEAETPAERPAEAQTGDDLFAAGGQLEPDLFAEEAAAPELMFEDKFMFLHIDNGPEGNGLGFIEYSRLFSSWKIFDTVNGKRRFWSDKRIEASIKRLVDTGMVDRRETHRGDALYTTDEGHRYFDTSKAKPLPEQPAAPVEPEQPAAEPVAKEEYPIGSEIYESGFKAKVLDISTNERGAKEYTVEYLEGPLKGQTDTAYPSEPDLIEPFDIDTTLGKVRIVIKGGALDFKEMQEIYNDPLIGQLNVEMHGWRLRDSLLRKGEQEIAFRSIAGLTIRAERPEQLEDLNWLKEQALGAVAGVLARGEYFGEHVSEGKYKGGRARIVGRSPDTIDEVLERSREPTADATPLNKIKITFEVGDEKISHMATWWVDAFDKRLKKIAKLRTCA